MTREEVENGREEMLIDGSEAEKEKQKNPVPDAFNPDYLKIYYGNLIYITNDVIFILLLLGSSTD